jgi:hypothetical protein
MPSVAKVSSGFATQRLKAVPVLMSVAEIVLVRGQAVALFSRGYDLVGQSYGVAQKSRGGTSCWRADDVCNSMKGRAERWCPGWLTLRPRGLYAAKISQGRQCCGHGQTR